MKPRPELPVPAAEKAPGPLRLPAGAGAARGVFGRRWFLAVAFRGAAPCAPARRTESRAA